MADPEWKWPLPDDLTREIFARAGYNDPLYIFQVARFCKDWFRALSDPDYADRLRTHHVAPVAIGLLHDNDDESLPTFVPTIKSPFVPNNVPDRREWRVLDYRHGRGLFISKRHGELGRQELLIWDPMTGVQRRVPVAPQAGDCIYPGAAVVCAVPGCDHRAGCNGGQFKVALVYSAAVLVDVDFEEDEQEQAESEMRCVMYSSATDNWEDEASLYGFSEEFGKRPSVLAGHSLFFLSDNLVLFELDLAAHTFTEIDLPEMDKWSPENEGSIILMLTVDGGLGIVEATDGNLFTWSREVDWTMAFTFDHYFTTGTIGEYEHSLLGFAEGTRDFFVASSKGKFSFELPLSMVNEVDELNVRRLEIEGNLGWVCPVVSLYTPYNALQPGLQQNLAEQQAEAPGEAPADDEPPAKRNRKV